MDHLHPTPPNLMEHRQNVTDEHLFYIFDITSNIRAAGIFLPVSHKMSSSLM